jgi:hypothetical protein
MMLHTIDVMEHSHLSNPEAKLGTAHTAQALDPALAHPGGLVAQVPFEGVRYLIHFGSP